MPPPIRPTRRVNLPLPERYILAPMPADPVGYVTEIRRSWYVASKRATYLAELHKRDVFVWRIPAQLRFIVTTDPTPRPREELLATVTYTVVPTPVHDPGGAASPLYVADVAEGRIIAHGDPVVTDDDDDDDWPGLAGWSAADNDGAR